MKWWHEAIRATAQALLSGAADEGGREIVRKIKARTSKAKSAPDGERKTNTMTTTLVDLMRRALALECQAKFTSLHGKIEFSQFGLESAFRKGPQKLVARVRISEEESSGDHTGFGDTPEEAVCDLCAKLEDVLRKRIEADQKALADAGGETVTP